MRKRSLSILAFLGVLSATAYGQGNLLTVAGGGPPNGATATSISVSNPNGVAVDAAGKLYVAVSQHNRVYVVATNGTVSVLAGSGAPGYAGDGGAATSAQLNGPMAVAVDSTGTNVYIADTGNNRIRKVTAGIISTAAGGGSDFSEGIAATSAQLGHPYGVAVDSAGAIYLTDSDYSRIRKVAGGVITTVAGVGGFGYSGDGGPAIYAQLGSPRGVAVDAAGTIYIADTFNYRVRKITAGVITTVAGTGGYGYYGEGVSALIANLGSPNAVAVDAAGAIYIADTSNDRIRKVSGGVITTIAGTNTRGYWGDGGAATDTPVNQPQGVAVSTGGSVYIADTNNYRVRKVAGGIITTAAGNGTQSYSGDGGLATSAQLMPNGIVADGSGNLYIGDFADYRVRKVAGGMINTVAGNGYPGYWGDGGQATSAQIGSATGLAMDISGNLYLADTDHNCIRKVTAGVITTVAGTGAPGYTGDNGLAISAQLSYPKSVAVDGSGNLYIADTSNNRIRKVSGGVITLLAGGGPLDGTAAASVSLKPYSTAVDSSGNVYVADAYGGRVYKISTNGAVSTVAGNGTQGFSGDGGPAASAQLSNPQGVAVDGAGNVYIADAQNGRIRKVSGGMITTVAGGGSSGLGDGGPASAARLSFPAAVAVDSAGANLYIADFGNSRIRKVTGGIITTVAGNGAYGYSGDGGSAVNAQLSYPMSIALDGTGNLYIADVNNSRVRKVAGGIITTVAGNGLIGFWGDGGPATSAPVAIPTGVAVDSAGNLYITDSNNVRIRKVVGGIISTVAGTGTSGFSGDGGAATGAQISSPNGIAVDSAGNLYIADTANCRIRKVSNGLISTFAGNGAQSSSGDGGPAVSAQLSSPTGLALDGAGNLYFSDSDSNRVRMISAAGTITTVAGTGAADYSGDGGAATSAALSSPRGLAVSNGTLYIADQGNGRLRAVSGGVIHTVAIVPGWNNLDSNVFRYAADAGVAVDSTGRVYVSSPFAGVVSQVTGVNPAGLGVSNSHSGNFMQRQRNAAYTVTVSNGAGASMSSGTVTVTETIPAGLSLVSMSGTGWTCTATTCTRTDTLQPGASYPAITVTVNVAADAPSQVTNQVTVSGGGSASASASDITTVTPAGPPQAVSATPSSGSGGSQTFNFVFSDPAGGADLASSYVSINNGVTACMVQADLTQGRLYLYNDGMTAWLGPITAGTSATLQNSQCTLSGTGSSVSVSGNQAALSLALAFKPAFTGPKNLFGYTSSVLGPNSGWTLLGTWTVPNASLPPQTVSVSPASGSGAGQTFNFVFSDSFGSANLAVGYASINDGVTSCMVQADLVHGSLYLLNDAMTGWSSPITMGTSATLQNNQCTLSATGSSVAMSGTQATLSLALSFKSTFAGFKNVFGYTQSASGLNSGWVSLGTWAVPGTAPPQAVSVTPSSGSGNSQTFRFVFSDPAGASDLTVAFASINNGASACTVQADLQRGLFYLQNDAQTGWLGPLAAGTLSTLQNYSCTLNGAASTIVLGGTQATLNLAVAFSSDFPGAKRLLGYAQNIGGLNSGWIQLGTWVVSGTYPPSAISVAPASGSGLGYGMFTFMYYDPAGASDLTAVYTSFNDGQKACMIQVDPVRGVLYLLNDAMTTWLGPVTMGTSGSLQNSQCTVGASSFVTMLGSRMTLALVASFKPAFGGLKNIYGYASSLGGLNSGWTWLGTWTVPGTQPPQAVSVTPSSGSGNSQTFSFVYSDPYGGNDLAYGYASLSNGVTTCQVQADLVHGTLYLLKDSQATWYGPITMGTAATLQNSQCTVSGTGSAVTVTGNQATLSLNLSFKPAFAGPKSVLGYAQSGGGLNSGWTSLGTFTTQ